MSLLDRLSRFIDDVLLLPEDVRARLDRAEDALEAGQTAAAASLFEDVLAERPSLARAAVGLAQARQGMGDLAGARAALETARRLAPDDPEVALLAARLALLAGDTAGAAEAARVAAMRLAATGGEALAEACTLRARAEQSRGRPDRAARELRKALSIRPDDPLLRVELVEALAASGLLAQARAVASGVAPEAVDDGAAVRLGLALHRAGSDEAAVPWLERGAAAGSDVALLVLARRDLSRARLAEAEQRVRRCVARGGGVEALTVLAEIALAGGRPGEAGDALEAAALAASAADATSSLPLWRAAVRTTAVTDAESLTRRADAVEHLAPADPAAQGARLWVALARDDLVAARALALGDGEPRVVLGTARWLMAEGRPGDALALLDAWPAAAARTPWAWADRDLAEDLRREALRALWRGPTGEVDLAAAIDAVVRFAAQRQLSAVERRASLLRDEIDRPLLLAVLGEFNAGKSTFINAFVGADVAPTGIVPTTSTLNMLRFGAERRVRVVRDDGTTREGDYEQLRDLLADAEATRIDHVEILLPSETLERVWILDTPGTNALEPEHERLAREAARRADAVLWIFDASQAGKDTEARALREIADSGRVVVCVLNKTDRLTADELGAVRGVLVEQLPWADDPIAISARDALRARLRGDAEGRAASGFDALLASLEKRVFSRSRQLKRAACASRLLGILDEALASEDQVVRDHDSRVALLADAASPLADAWEPLADAVDEALGHLDADLAAAVAEAAHEVLAFVRPRSHRFARHGADPEDRAFLLEVLERRTGAAAEAFRRRLIPRARGVLAAPVEAIGIPQAVLDARVRSAVTAPVSSWVGYQRGLLAGGRMQRFFDEVLPRATLEVGAIAETLAVLAADPRTELRPALLDSLADLGNGIEADRAAAHGVLRAERETLRSRVYAPLRALRAVLAELI